MSLSPLVWRTAALVDPKSRAAFGFVAPADLERFLAADPPAGILTGVERHELEVPFLDYAQSHGYLSHSLPDPGVLWLPPK